MQRPRRTSELHDDPGVVRRPSRATTTAPSPSGGGTAVKYSARQSRIAVRARSTSLDRGHSNNAYLSVPSSSVQRGMTPQKTPMTMKTPSANRVLFTAEKSRGGTASNNVALHNDKKWVQEQTHRITDYLLNQPTISGLSPDFLQRGLRQMSIKQFVAIVNFFLNHIWGKRYVVGTNHVEDITQIVQKLQYPHAMNKSWLKTPNTQHSFGNVIVLFDFLMDFVSQSEEDFELQDPLDPNTSGIHDDFFKIPDLEFQRELLLKTEDGFMLWDTQMHDEFNSLQQETCNLLIKKVCHFEDAAALDSEIHKLNGIWKSLQDQRPQEDKDMIKLKSKIAKELEELRTDYQLLNQDYHKKNRDLKHLNRDRIDVSYEVNAIEGEMKSLKSKISKQICTLEKRDQMISELKQLEHMLGIQERTVRDLENRSHNQQVYYARLLKEVTDAVESFNTYMREIAFSNVRELKKIPAEALRLPLRPEEAHINKLIPILERIKEQIQQSIIENKNKILQTNQHAKQVDDEADVNLEMKLTSLQSLNAQSSKTFEQLCRTAKEGEAKMNANIQEMQNQLMSVEKHIETLQERIKQQEEHLQNLKNKNEATMKEGEEKHERYLENRRTFIESHDQMIEHSMQSDEIKSLMKNVQEQEKQIEAFKNEIEIMRSEVTEQR